MGEYIPPAQVPSGSCRPSSRAPQPSVATLRCSRVTERREASIKSRRTCQRMAGSPARSHDRVDAGVRFSGTLRFYDRAVYLTGRQACYSSPRRPRLGATVHRGLVGPRHGLNDLLAPHPVVTTHDRLDDSRPLRQCEENLSLLAERQSLVGNQRPEDEQQRFFLAKQRAIPGRSDDPLIRPNAWQQNRPEQLGSRRERGFGQGQRCRIVGGAGRAGVCLVAVNGPSVGLVRTRPSGPPLSPLTKFQLIQLGHPRLSTKRL